MSRLGTRAERRRPMSGDAQSPPIACDLGGPRALGRSPLALRRGYRHAGAAEPFAAQASGRPRGAAADRARGHWHRGHGIWVHDVCAVRASPAAWREHLAWVTESARTRGWLSRRSKSAPPARRRSHDRPAPHGRRRGVRRCRPCALWLTSDGAIRQPAGQAALVRAERRFVSPVMDSAGVGSCARSWCRDHPIRVMTPRTPAGIIELRIQSQRVPGASGT